MMQQGTAERRGQRLGHYTLTGEAGRGGMSVVYEATDDRIGRRVALKAVTVPGHLSSTQRDELIARLRREARSIARLSHPNVVNVYDVGEDAGTHFVVMEFLEGQTLRQRLEDGPLLPEEAAKLLDQVAGALDAVHAEGVVHRDIKPSNVMLLPDGRVKLMDFGVARQADDTLLTQAGMMVGSPSYMAPEIINGDGATRASDLWSLGVLLYQALAGRPPFDAKNIPTVLYQVTHAHPEPISGLPPRVQAVLARALQRDPARRYQSARDLAGAFRAALETSQATGGRTPRPIHRSRRPWVPLLTGFALLLAVLGAAFWGHRLRSGSLVVGRTAATSHAARRVASAHGKNTHITRGRPHTPRIAAVSAPRRPRIRVAALRQERRWSVPAPLRVTKMRRPRFARVALVSQTLKQRYPAQDFRPRRVRWTHPARAAQPQRPNPPNKPNPPNTFLSADTPQPATQTAVTGGARNLSGTWHGWQGIHSHDPATLTIHHSSGSTFDGVMTVRTPEHATVRVALTGHVAPDGGVTMRETHILSSTKPHAWDLGFKSGRLGAGGQMQGTDQDVTGRRARWSFTR